MAHSLGHLENLCQFVRIATNENFQCRCLDKKINKIETMNYSHKFFRKISRKSIDILIENEYN